MAETLSEALKPWTRADGGGQKPGLSYGKAAAQGNPFPGIPHHVADNHQPVHHLLKKTHPLISAIGPRELTQNSKIIANASSMVMLIYLSVAHILSGHLQLSCPGW